MIGLGRNSSELDSEFLGIWDFSGELLKSPFCFLFPIPSPLDKWPGGCELVKSFDCSHYVPLGTPQISWTVQVTKRLMSIESSLPHHQVLVIHFHIEQDLLTVN